MHAPSMFAIKANIYGVPIIINQALDETYSYWSAPKNS